MTELNINNRRRKSISMTMKLSSHSGECAKFIVLSVLVLGHQLVVGQEILDFGAKDRAEAERLQQVIEELCRNRPVNEYFRLSAESNCRDAVRCVNNDFGGGPKLAAIRCPAGLVFDLDGQTCNWASQVKACSNNTYPIFIGRLC